MNPHKIINLKYCEIFVCIFFCPSIVWFSRVKFLDDSIVSPVKGWMRVNIQTAFMLALWDIQYRTAACGHLQLKDAGTSDSYPAVQLSTDWPALPQPVFSLLPQPSVATTLLWAFLNQLFPIPHVWMWATCPSGLFHLSSTMLWQVTSSHF